MKGFLKIIGLFLLLLSISSCRSDKPPSLVTGPEVSGTNRVWVCNEGNFQQANSELGIFNPEKNEYSSNVFSLANGIGPGDVLQSIYFYNGLAYLIVNNSGKIIVVDTSSFRAKREITGLVSPRYMLEVAPLKAYISDLYGDALAVVDLSTDTVLGSIKCGGWTEKMWIVGNEVFVSMPQNDHVYIVDILSDQVVDSIKVAYGSNSLVLDKNQDLWVLCSGSTAENEIAGLFKIDPVGRTVLNKWDLNEAKLPSNLAIDQRGENLYFIYEDLFQMGIDEPTIPAVSLYPSGGKLFYGMNLDKARNEIYLANAKDFVQKGEAFRIDSSGNLLTSFRTGFNPNGFYFEN